MMNRIEKLFEKKKKKLLNVYFTAGYPNLESTVELIQYLTQAGADIIELGMPYSDPLADGPTIQNSSQIALKNGVNLPLIFEQVKEARKHSDIPIILMGYYNQMLQFGTDQFLDTCLEVGIDGLILPDLPMDIYEKNYKVKLEARDLGISFLVTPNTSDERIKIADKFSRGFLYVVSQSSITGSAFSDDEQKIAYFEKLDQLELKNPKLIGFGIHDHETFEFASRFANGAIIGSAFIKALGESRGNLEKTTRDFVSSIITSS